MLASRATSGVGKPLHAEYSISTLTSMSSQFRLGPSGAMTFDVSSLADIQRYIIVGVLLWRLVDCR